MIKIKNKDLKAILTLFKTVEEKEKTITLAVKDKRLIASARANGMALELKRIKVDSEDISPFAIQKDFLQKLTKSTEEIIELKLNKKTVTSKIRRVTSRTTMLGEKHIVELEEKEPKKGSQIILTSEIIKALSDAKKFINKKATRIEIQAINLKLKDKTLYINATDTFRLYINEFKTDAEGQFNILLTQEAVEVLEAISESFGSTPIPIIVSELGIFIKAKVMYFEANLIERQYPDVERIITRVKEENKFIFEHNFSEEDITSLKTIANSKTIMRITKEGEFVEFKVSDEIEANSFLIVPEKETGEIDLAINPQNLEFAVNLISEAKFTKSVALLEQDNLKILLMLMRVN